jgi:Flp pilus assembly secretin CpaC
MRLRPNLYFPLIALPFLACQAPTPPAGGSAQPESGTSASAPVDLRDLLNNPEPSGNQSAIFGKALPSAPMSGNPKLLTAQPVAAAPAGLQQGILQDEATRQALARDRANKLSNEYQAAGESQLDRAQLDEALESFATALDLNPANQAARDGFLKAKALKGDPAVLAETMLLDEVARQTVIRAEARIAAAAAVKAADQARTSGDMNTAIAKYSEADLILSLHPLIADTDLDRQVLARRLESARAERDEREADGQRLAREEAERLTAQAEEENRNYRFNTLKETYSRANQAFRDERYLEAKELAEQILMLDPGNEQAVKLREIAQQAHFQKASEEFRRRYREDWLATMQEVEQESLPQTESLVYDDLERWKEVRQRKPYEFTPQGARDDSEKAQILEKLKNTQVPARFSNGGDGTSLEVVRDFLQSLTGVNFLISPAAAELDVTVNIDLSERSVFSILQVIQSTSEELRWKIESGTVKFVTGEELGGDLNFRVYEVRDLVRPPRDFQPLDINVLPTGGLELPEEDPREPEATVLTGDDLVSVIQDNIAPDSWGEASISATEGQLVVYQAPEVHEQISRLLDELREAAGLMVQIQTRFLKVSDTFLEDIGVDFRGLGAPGKGDSNFFNDFGAPGSLNNQIGQDTDVGAFYEIGENGDIKSRVENLFDSSLGGDIDNSGGLAFQWTFINDMQLELILQAVSKNQRAELVTAPSILVFNTARSNIQVLNQVAYVQDFDVQIATAAAIADPIIQVVQDGVVLDVRPVISADRRFVTLDLRPTVATLVRPIQEVSTSLASTGTVTIQLPELELQRMRTVVSVPDGGTLLLGGLKSYESQELRSGVPILNKIPLVSFFFDRKGNYIAKEKTLILLKAEIVIPAEYKPTDAQLGVQPTPPR